MEIGYSNDEWHKLMREHIMKYHKVMSFNAPDVHILLYQRMFS